MNQPNLRTVLRNAILALLLFALCAPSTAQAGQSIEFTHEGVSQGFTLDGQAFPGQFDFIITAFGDIGERQEAPGGGGWRIEHTAAMIEIVGVGTFGIVTPTQSAVNNSTGLIGFGRAGTNGSALLVGPTDPVFFDWDMTTSIGPIFGNDGRLLQWNIEPRIETTGGTLVFDDEEDIPVIFTAEVIPAPGPIALLAPAAAGAFCILRRRRRC